MQYFYDCCYELYKLNVLNAVKKKKLPRDFKEQFILFYLYHRLLTHPVSQKQKPSDRKNSARSQ